MTRNLIQAEAEPWVVTREGYEKMFRAISNGSSILELKARGVGLEPSAALGLTDNMTTLDVAANGTAVIPIAGYLTRFSYWRGDNASYEWIGDQVKAAIREPAVTRIVLNVDSPGGQVSGTEDLSSLIFEARSEKPIIAFVGGQAASAAYWLSSAASEIQIGRTSMLGSIGVIWTFTDWSKYDAKLGIKEIDIVSSQSPNKNIDPTTKSGRELIQATVDQLAGVFVEDVARNRGVSEEVVISDFGQGWVLVGEAAVKVGLADGIDTFDNVVHGSSDDPLGTTLAVSEHGDPDMDTVEIKDITAEWLAEHCPDVVVVVLDGYVANADHESALEALVKEQNTTASASIDDERARILGIQEAAHGMGLSKLAAELVADPKMSVEGAKARLFEAVSAKRKGSLDALKGDEDELDTPDPDVTDEDEKAADAALLKSAADYAASTAMGIHSNS